MEYCKLGMKIKKPYAFHIFAFVMGFPRIVLYSISACTRQY